MTRDDDPTVARGPAPSSGRWRMGLLALAVVGLLVAIALPPVRSWLLALAGWIREAGAAGVITFAAVYVVGSVLLLPASLLTLTAGFAYGPLLGVPIAWGAATAAASAAFLVGRFVARERARQAIAGQRVFSAIDRAIERDGLRVVVLLRLSPLVPFNVLNYGLALSSVRFRDYVLGSAVGMVPGATLYVYLGSLVTSAARLGGDVPASPWSSVLYWGGLAATVVVTVLLTRLARAELARSLGDTAAKDDPPAKDDPAP